MTNTGVFERGGRVVRPDHRLGEIIHRRPPGITGHQWTTAHRARLDFVVFDAAADTPTFAIAFDDAGTGPGHAEDRRAGRLTNAVCDAAGLGVLRISSTTLRPDRHGRKITEYVLDARAFAGPTVDGAAVAGAEPAGVSADPLADLLADPLPEPLADRPQSYREIIGRLPNGRSGFVNDLGALARAAAIDAYADRRLSDPILRGLHLRWREGAAEGWAWLDVRDGWCLYERVVLRPQRVSCGIDAGQLAEDLAAMAIGERLKTMDDDVEPVLYDKAMLLQDIQALRLRREEMLDLSDTDHICG